MLIQTFEQSRSRSSAQAKAAFPRSRRDGLADVDRLFKLVVAILLSNTAVRLESACVVDGIDSSTKELVRWGKRSHCLLQQCASYALAKVTLIERVEWGISHLWMSQAY